MQTTSITRLSRLLGCAVTVAAAGACAAPDAGDSAACEGAKCDGLDGDQDKLDSPCADALFDHSGRGFLPARLAQDPLVQHVYMDGAAGCPVTMPEIMAALAKSDDDGCKAVGSGLQTRAISEQAQLTGGKGASYRTITSRTCSGREDFGLLFSMFGFSDSADGKSEGLDPGGSEVPDGIEIIAFDETSGVFNYYKEIDGKMGFFGSSTDFVTMPPGGPDLTDVRGCANCHTGGGPIMKELASPWLHWEGTFDSPGVDELVGNRKAIMGKVAGGPNLETTVIEPGNQKWNQRRVEFLRDNGSMQNLLRPLFCPNEVNVASFNKKDGIGARFLYDRQLTERLGITTSTISLDGDAYDRITAALGQNVPGTDEADVVAPFAFIERSFTDRDYVDQLVAAGVIDDDFVIDVLMVDFTRPVFSDDRCDLLDLAPDLQAADRTPDEIRDGFLANLAGAETGTAAAQLRAHLQARADGKPLDHEATVRAFRAACTARQKDDVVDVDGTDESAFHVDVLKLRSLGRKTAFVDGSADTLDGSASHPRSVFEFDDTLPIDDVTVTTQATAGNVKRVHPQARFSPVDCTLVTGFVATGAAAGQ